MPESIVLSSEGKILFESALSRTEVLEQNGLLDVIRRRPARHKKGEYCLLTHPWEFGYYHWMMEILPKLSIIQRFARLDDVPLIVPSPLKRFQAETLSLAGIPSHRLAEIDRSWRVDRLHFPEIFANPGNPAPEAVAWLRSTFLKEGDPIEPRRRLYVTRRDAPQRKLLNETEVSSFLATLGFETVCPGELSVAEQIALFRSASIVVAPHGAALTNMVFAPADCAIVEIFGENYINGCYWALASILGQDHTFVVGEAAHLDYRVPLASLEKVIHEVVKRSGGATSRQSDRNPLIST